MSDFLVVDNFVNGMQYPHKNKAKYTRKGSYVYLHAI